MNWSDIRDVVSGAAPALGTLLGGPAGGAVGAVIASALGTNATPQSVVKAIQGDPEAAAKLRQIEADESVTLRRLTLESETARLAEVNKTIRAEVSSSDPFVRRARPMFLYVVAFSIAMEVLVAVYVVAVGESMAELAALYQALSIPQSIAAAMCGVYLKKRSDDKAVAAGYQPQGLLQSMFGGRP